jgi:signal peptidase I
VTEEGAGWALRSRDLGKVVLLSVVLFPFYPLFWYLRLSSELRRELRKEPGTPLGSPVWLTALMVTFGWGLLVVPAISFYETAWRIRRLQRRRAMPQSSWYSYPFLTGLLLIAFVGPLVLPGGWWAQVGGWAALLVVIGDMQRAVNRIALEPARPPSTGRRVLLWLISVPYAVILVASASLFGSGQLQLLKVHTTAMAPAIQCGDEVMVESASIHGPLGVGDIVLFGHNGKTLVSRVASIDGDQLTVRNDNPGNGSDSRAIGPIQKSDVSRVVYAVEWPISHLGPLGRSPSSGTAKSCS